MQNIKPKGIPSPEFLWNRDGRDMYCWRLDQIHPEYGGNKLLKVWPYLQRYASGKYTGIASMGGPFSNHLTALACLCRERAIPFHALVRSHKPDHSNPIIRYLIKSGANVKFVSPEVFQNLRSGQDHAENWLHVKKLLWVPEGGRSEEAILQVSAIVRSVIPDQTYNVCLACGTGATAAGMAAGLPDSNVFAFLALKLPEKSMQYFPEADNLTYIRDAHWGGFGRWKPELIHFMNLLFETTGIITDPVYTGKLFYAVSRQLPLEINAGNMPLLIVHTGGITGNVGFDYLHPGILHPELIPDLTVQ